MSTRGVTQFVVASVFAFIFLTSFASAAFYLDLHSVSRDMVRAYVDFFEPILQALFGGLYGSSLLLFEKLLIFIILISVIFLATGKVPLFKDQKAVRWVIALVVPLIAIRFISYEWLTAIIVQYQVLGIVLAAFLPFVLFFFFLYNVGGDYPVMRKIGWIFFIGIYLGIWSSVESDQASIYFWTMIAALFFLLFDGTIMRYYRKEEMKAAGSLNKWEHVAKLRRDIEEINNTPGLPESVRKKLIKKKTDRIKDLLKSDDL